MKTTAADKFAANDKSQLLRNQMDETYFACETLSCDLNNRLNVEDSVGKYFDINTIGLAAKLRSMYESIILGDPQCLANEAERQMWQCCFQQFFDPISSNATKLDSQQLKEAMELLHIATNYYFCLIRKLAKTGSAEIEEVVLLAPTSLRWNRPKYERQDEFVVEMVHRMYIHMGDIVRYRSAIFPTVVYRAYPTAEKLYQCALSLRPDEGVTYSRLALLCSSVGRNIEAACYHLKGSLTKQKSEACSRYLSFLLTQNERHHYLYSEEGKGIYKRSARVRMSEAFVSSTVRAAHYVYSSTAESQGCRLPAVVQENIHLLRSCFQLLLSRQFPGFVYGDINSDTILSLVTMQMTLVELLQEKGCGRQLIAEQWLLSVFQCVLELVVQLVRYEYSSVPSMTDCKNCCINTTANGASISAAVNLGSRITTAPQLMTTSRHTKTTRTANRNDKDLAKDLCVVVLGKLRALQQISWMKVVKVICHWLDVHPDRLRNVSPEAWTHFVALMNLVPTEPELSDLYARDKEVAKAVGGLFFTPLSQWTQEVPFPEDAGLFKILKSTFGSSSVSRRFSDLAMCFLRVCSLRKYARGFVRLKFTGLRFDNWIMEFVPSTHIHDGSMDTLIGIPESSPLGTVTNGRDLQNRESFYGQTSLSSRPTTFVIVDALSLCSHLSFLKEMVQSKEITIVICMSVTDQLCKWKAGMSSARTAIGWIEYEWDHSNRALMIRTNDSRSKKWEGKSADITLELVRMYKFLVKKSPYEMRRIVLLTGYSSGSEEFERIYAQAARRKVKDINLRNVSDFYAEWITKEH